VEKNETDAGCCWLLVDVWHEDNSLFQKDIIIIFVKNVATVVGTDFCCY